MMPADEICRVEIFFDLYNIYAHIRNKGLKLDYLEMVNRLAEGRQITAKFVFDAYEQHGFDPSRRVHEKLRHNGFILILRPYDPNKKKQKGVDSRLTLEMYKRARDDMYDIALMITGDGDFVPVCEDVQALGKKVEVAAFDGMTSFELKKVADRYHDLRTVSFPMPTKNSNYMQPEVSY